MDRTREYLAYEPSCTTLVACGPFGPSRTRPSPLDKRLEAVAGDAGVMNEEIPSAAGRRDESVALLARNHFTVPVATDTSFVRHERAREAMHNRYSLSGTIPEAVGEPAFFLTFTTRFPT